MHQKPFRNRDPLLVDDEFLERLGKLVEVVQQQVTLQYVHKEGLDEEQAKADIGIEPFANADLMRRHHRERLRELIRPDIDIYYADDTQDDATSIAELREYLGLKPNQRVEAEWLS